VSILTWKSEIQTALRPATFELWYDRMNGKFLISWWQVAVRTSAPLNCRMKFPSCCVYEVYVKQKWILCVHVGAPTPHLKKSNLKHFWFQAFQIRSPQSALHTFKGESGTDVNDSLLNFSLPVWILKFTDGLSYELEEKTLCFMYDLYYTCFLIVFETSFMWRKYVHIFINLRLSEQSEVRDQYNKNSKNNWV
jgi:hypothetical protein